MSFCAENRFLPALLVAVGLLAGAAPAAAADEALTLKVDGDFGSRFAATCLLNSEAGKESFSIDRTAPFEATFTGSGLRCEITTPFAIEVDLRKGGSRSFGSISRGTVNVNVGS